MANVWVISQKFEKGLMAAGVTTRRAKQQSAALYSTRLRQNSASSLVCDNQKINHRSMHKETRLRASFQTSRHPKPDPTYARNAVHPPNTRLAMALHSPRTPLSAAASGTPAHDAICTYISFNRRPRQLA